MKKAWLPFGVIILLIAQILYSGFSPSVLPHVYFTVYYGNQRIDITDEILRNGWWNSDSQNKYSNGKSIYERAESAVSIKKDFPEIWLQVEKIRRAVEAKPHDGVIMFEPLRGGKTTDEHQRFHVSGQRDGCDLDENLLCKDILKALKSKKHVNITAKLKKVSPKDEDAILDRVGVRGSYTTHFEDNDAREHNIALALSCFNGLVVQSGESVSFNKVVGPRTRERGYREAKIILDGEFVPGTGGGVCQASTTLFNAVLLAGLDVDKSYNHSLAISYVPIGRDAMVSSASDLVFTNNSGGTIYIEAGATSATGRRSGSAFVRIYGNKTNIKYKPRTEVKEAELKQGEIDPARSAKTYIEAWSGNKLVHSKIVRKSSYKAVKSKEIIKEEVESEIAS